MINLELKHILLLIVSFFAIVTIIFLLKNISTAISNSYVNKNKERLFNDNMPLSQECKDLGSLLLEKKNLFWVH